MNTHIATSPRDLESLEENIRERAYFLWLDRGCPHGEDWEHWFAAKEQLETTPEPAPVESPTSAKHTSAQFSIKKTLATHLDDPTHRFHATEKAHDDRTTVVAGEARQRIRGRHFDSSLRAQPKSRSS